MENSGFKELLWLMLITPSNCIYFQTISVYMQTLKISTFCTTIHRYPIFSARYSIMCKVYTGYYGRSGIEHGLCACMVNFPLAKARGLSLHTVTQTMLYLSLSSPVRLYRKSYCTSHGVGVCTIASVFTAASAFAKC